MPIENLYSASLIPENRNFSAVYMTVNCTLLMRGLYFTNIEYNILGISYVLLNKEISGVGASKGVGAVLMQARHPIAFEIRKLTKAEKHYAIYDKEMLAIMHALAKFRQYLFCGRFIVKTHHNNLRFFFIQKDLNDRQQKWVSRN